jgi:hypothetical protein
LEQQELQVAGADFAAGPETVAATAAVSPVPAEEAATMAMSAARATASADTAVPPAIFVIFIEKSHISSFVVGCDCVC